MLFPSSNTAFCQTERCVQLVNTENIRYYWGVSDSVTYYTPCTNVNVSMYCFDRWDSNSKRYRCFTPFSVGSLLWITCKRITHVASTVSCMGIYVVLNPHWASDWPELISSPVSGRYLRQFYDEVRLWSCQAAKQSTWYSPQPPLTHSIASNNV